MKKRRKIIDMDMLEIWNQVLENLEGNVSPVGFNIHIKTAVPVCFENSTFTISVATSIKKLRVLKFHLLFWSVTQMS